MKLIDVLTLISDYTNVRVFDSNKNELARYNGKDSIPEELNDEVVSQIHSGLAYENGNEIPYIGIKLAM